MTPSLPTAEDVAMLARLHIAAWHETYSTLLPKAEIDRASVPGRRQAQWADGGRGAIPGLR